MKHGLRTMLSSASVLVLAPQAFAQSPASVPGQSDSGPELDPQASSGGPAGNDIVVTARRKNETLLDVPQSVAVVTSEQVEKYSVLRMLDIQKVVPGLELSDGNGFAQNTSMRGVTFNQVQALPQTVAFYLNDVNIRPQQAYQAFFDIGQVEVLRGPQGTSRGIISPSGAITLTTRRPDLEEAGGYLQGTVGLLANSNIQGAVGVPIVPGKLAIRIAGVRDVNEENGVRSVFTGTRPRQKSEALRVTALIEPIDDLRAVLTYQHLSRSDVTFGAGVFGNGTTGIPGNPFAGPGFNGPPIDIDDLRTNAPGPERASLKGDTFQAQVDWTFAGQKLSYILGHSSFKSFQSTCVDEPGSTSPFPCFPQVNNSKISDWTHEVRLSSVERLFGSLDYTIGYLRSRTTVPTVVDLAPTFLTGAFGNPALPVPGQPNYDFAVLGQLITDPNAIKEDAIFGSLTLHLGDKTEITAGVRRSWINNTISVALPFQPALIALPASVIFPNGPDCAVIPGCGVPYPGYLNAPVPLPSTQFSYSEDHNPWIYNVELSHKFTPDLMAYARVANSYRMGQISLALAVSTDNPALSQYLIPRPEKSTSYEIGVKGSLFERRLQFDINYYHQNFKNYLYLTLPTYFLKTQGASPMDVSSTTFTANADAVVDGVELSVTARPIPQWSTTFNLAWTNGRLKNAAVPCNSSTFNGVADEIRPTVAQFVTAGQSVAICNSNAATTNGPRWTFNVQTEFEQPIDDRVSGFIRGLATYRGRNPNASAVYVIPAYAIFDLYLGLRAPDGRWEVSLYGKNITNKRTILTQAAPGSDLWANGLSSFFGQYPDPLNPNGPAINVGTGYFPATLTARREVGMSARFAFGSR